MNGANTFSGGVGLNAGLLQLGNAQALGTGQLDVGGNASLDAASALTVTNNIGLAAGANLTVLGSNDLTLAGPVFGVGGLIRTVRRG